MKKLALWIATVCLVFSAVIPSVAAAEPPVETVQTSQDTRSQEVIWVTRVYNGKQQKRLWSVTYGYWLTDWIDC